MSKTPVSTLQEYVAKKGLGVPEYVIVAQTCGTHLPSFTYRVKCLGKSADGTATSKKEAKHNAAKEMLKLLSSGQESFSSPSLSPQKNPLVDSYYSPGASNNTHDDIFINSVGKLNEHCASRKLKAPVYALDDISGPDHMRVFTITCSIGSLSAKATASTKKQAKHDAAQNMYQRLMTSATSKTYQDLHQTEELKKCFDEAELKLRNIKIVDIKMKDLPLPYAESCAKAQEYFPKLRYRDSVKIVKNVEVQDYHEALKKSVSEQLRDKTQKQLDTRDKIVDKRLTVKNNEFVLTDVLKVLNLNLQCETVAKHNGECVVRCILDTTPIITDIGIGKNVDEAKELACSNLLKSIYLLLK